MKKILVLLIIFMLYGCQSKLPTVHVFVYDLSDPFIKGLTTTLSTNGKSQFNIIVHDAQNSQIIQNEMIIEALNDSPDLLIVNPVDRLGAYTIIEKVKQVDIPIIFFNREPLLRDLELYDQAYYVGSKAEESGIFQAQMISELFGESSRILNQFDLNQDNTIQMVIFKGEQGHQDAELRTSFVQSELIAMDYELDVLSVIIANWNETEAYNKAVNLFKDRYEDIEVIVSNNDAMALGIIRAMEEYHEEKLSEDENYVPYFIPVLGIDGITRALEMLEQGALYATVINDSHNQALAILNLGSAILSNNLDLISHNLTDDNYIWIPYKKVIVIEDLAQ